ncbi:MULTISPECIES: Uma2 family endonuclease [unclassified Streptomyces]|jgi:Uma2 family endonuclease|uniref:Uma2 family endonuclease n=1 Tax=unclassified Streptomyces TaxID=2593676 RepID=UPI00339ED4AD
MTALDERRIEMAENSDERTLDEMFQWLESAPEGFKVEIVEGAIFMSPQRDIHWQIIRRIVRALEDRFGMDVTVTSDVRIDFPGTLNGFAPDVAKIRDGAEKDAAGRWRHQDVEFVAEVVSKGTGHNDYGPKKAAYAAAGVPAYLVADPYQRKCHLYTAPKEGDYATETTVVFGTDLDLTGTPVGLTLTTADFPRE